MYLRMWYSHIVTHVTIITQSVRPQPCPSIVIWPDVLFRRVIGIWFSIQNNSLGSRGCYKSVSLCRELSYSFPSYCRETYTVRTLHRSLPSKTFRISCWREARIGLIALTYRISHQLGLNGVRLEFLTRRRVRFVWSMEDTRHEVIFILVNLK